MPDYVPLYIFYRMDAVQSFYLHHALSGNVLARELSLDFSQDLDYAIKKAFSDDFIPDCLRKGKAENNIISDENIVNKKFVESIEGTSFIKKMKKYCGSKYEEIAEQYFRSKYFFYEDVRNNKILFKKYEYEFRYAYLIFYRSIAKAFLMYFKDKEADKHKGIRSTLPKTIEEIDAINKLIRLTDSETENGKKLCELLAYRLNKLKAHKLWLDTITVTTGQNYVLTILIIRLIHSLSNGFRSHVDIVDDVKVYKVKVTTVNIISVVIYAIGVISDYRKNVSIRFDDYMIWYEEMGFLDFNMSIIFPYLYDL